MISSNKRFLNLISRTSQSVAAWKASSVRTMTTKPLKHESSNKRTRALFNGKYIFDALSGHYVWEHQYYPTLYVPLKSLTSSASFESSGSKSQGMQHGLLRVGKAKIGGVVVIEEGELEGMMKVPFHNVDTWFEEDQEIYVHPKDPYKRIDTLSSTREVVVSVSGTEIARSTDNVFLYETTLPRRYYLAKTGLKWEYLRESKSISLCPYKGSANYYDIVLPNGEVHKDAVWWYQNPTAESLAIQGRACFYNEKVDIWIDGVKEERPKSKFG